MQGSLAPPAGWLGAGALTGAALGDSAVAAGTFLLTNPVGWAILGTAAVGVAAYGIYSYAHSQSQAKFIAQTITQACSTCHNCNDLANKIKDVRDELKQRYDEMREDANGLYEASPNPIPGKEYLGTWPGHQQQFEQKQTNLRKMLNASDVAGCASPPGDNWSWASKDAPTQPAPKS